MEINSLEQSNAAVSQRVSFGTNRGAAKNAALRVPKLCPKIRT
jgi:hypothetical protein